MFVGADWQILKNSNYNNETDELRLEYKVWNNMSLEVGNS
jgi:hypothetical protein